MNMSSRVKPFGFDRVFDTDTSSRRTTVPEMQLEIEHLELEIVRLRKELEQSLNVARAEAFQAGLDHARTEREAALLSAADALQASLERFEVRFTEVEEGVAREGATVAITAANYLAGREISRLPCAAIEEAIGRALSQIRRGQPILVRVHPDLADELEAIVAERQSKDRRRLNLSVLSDPAVPLGDAKFCWDSGEMVLNAEARREAITRELEALYPND